jgi:hypothetical protein
VIALRFLRNASFVSGFLLLGLIQATHVGAQTATPKPPDSPVKFDEYGYIGGCDHSARLDNLAIQLQNDPGGEAQVVYHGPEGAGKYTLEIIKDYLVNSRGIVEDRIHSIYGGPNDDLKEPRIQLWVAPLGSLPPPLTRYVNKIDTFSGLFDDSPRWDGISGDGGTGPPVPDTTGPSFAEMLSKRKNTMPYIVAFNGVEASPGAWRRVAQLEIERLENFGLESGRLKVIYGGTAEETKIQLWILPEHAPPPVTDVPTEPAPEKTVQIGSFTDADLADEHSERWAFAGFVDVLRSNEKLRSCIIVRLESDEAEDSDSEEKSESEPVAASTPEEITPEPIEIPRADILKLVEKWRSELAGTHKIREDRFIVLFVTVPKDYGNSLETWIVPPGAPLPDPNAKPEEESFEEEEPVETTPVNEAPAKRSGQPEGIKTDKVSPDKGLPDKAQPVKNDQPRLSLPDA